MAVEALRTNQVERSRSARSRVLVRGWAVLAAGALALLVQARSVTQAAPSPTTLARGTLLVAGPNLEDPNFARSVVLLLVYDADGGAMGVIVNRPTPVRLAAVLPDVDGLADRTDRIWRGGPVLPTALITLVRSREALEGSEALVDDVRVLTSRDAVLASLRRPVPPDRLRAFAGHAGWAPGQLEAEMARGDWTVVPATAEHVFSATPEALWPKLERSSSGQWTEYRPEADGRSAREAIARGVGRSRTCRG